MGITARDMILFLTISSAFIGHAHAGSCGGGACSIGGGSSYDFLGDPSSNVDMDTFDEFLMDKLGQTSLSTKSIPLDYTSTNLSINQTNPGNMSLNSTKATSITDNPGSGMLNNTIVKIGTSGNQDERISSLAFTIFNNVI
jgi:hypothetical protein